MEFYNTTMSVLSDLGADTKQMLVVFNKVDKVSDPSALFALRRHFPDAVSVSALTGEGMDELVERISEFVTRGTMTVELRLPAARADLLARLHRDGTVREIRYDGEFTTVAATIPTRALEVFAPFLAAPLPEPLDAAVPASTK
jgi:GTP-binding protein HflX